MGTGGTFLQVLSSDSLSAPLSSITDEPDEYTSSPHTKPPTPPAPLIIPKRGPLAAIVRSESFPDSPGSPISGVIDLTHQIKTLSTYAFAHGGFADIHLAEWKRRSEDGEFQSIQVVIKLLRILTRQDVDGVRARKRLNREVYVWHRLDHLNVARMFGTSYHMGARPAIVLEWYQNGNASEYLKKNPNADRKMLIHDTARGLNYLHTLNPPIVHGDLKGNNVLITRACRAVLTDFGLSQVIEDLKGPSGNTTTMVQGSIRWQAPEIVLDDENNQKLQLTFPSDVWSFACTAYELLTGNLPYHNRLRDFSVIQDHIHGVKPGAPDTNIIYAPGPQDKIWELLDRCWSYQPYMRPLMKDVEAEMENMRY
ncbi:hypothetical protein PILCRDRAFT_817698 [Piloderma croceum F 1598]|uniref:Protein kinase domain-containing protein n=1 Tax=Piloderma croceum (strain F 1598) TaxID=765440 RepID=A0A0C3BF00_PILCF|nr:hypothetical protein PILCRDRAFT_817698 [Piloderma croceum F 1598]